jgi:FlaA1/EpsC-like NDP-sugar epimerase
MVQRLKIGNSLLALSRFTKRVLVVGIDAFLCVASVAIAFYLRLGEMPSAWWPLVITSVLVLTTALPVFAMMGLYRAIFRYAGWSAIANITRAILMSSIPLIAIVSMIGIPNVPRTMGIIQPILLLLLVGLSRIMAKAWLGEGYQSLLNDSKLTPVAIYGAGSAGRQLASALASGSGMRVAAFLDDDVRLQGQTSNGIPILTPSALGQAKPLRGVQNVLLAIPSATRQRRTSIIEELRARSMHVQTLPGLSDLAQGRVSLNDVRELDIDDLLGRDAVGPDSLLLTRTITGLTALVTGAGGSIGSELSRQIAMLGPQRLLLLEVNEFALYNIHRELDGIAGDVEIVPLLGSVCDVERMRDILSVWPIDTIYHAAAYKHVPLVERNIAQGLLNNVGGTATMARLARDFAVPNFVLVSTDKAVRPTNVMGASKRLAEMVLQALAQDASKTKFSMVRFGNVLGSSGSVVPLFRQQIRDGGPVTVTHLEMTRYFMTIPEAAQLVIQAGAMAIGGEVYVLNMGEPVRIADLATNMIELSGLTVRDEANPDGEIEIVTIGLRPGEKLYEELLIGNNPAPTPHPRVMKANDTALSPRAIDKYLRDLFKLVEGGDMEAVRELLMRIVPEYRPNSSLADPIHRPANVLQRTRKHA